MEYTQYKKQIYKTLNKMGKYSHHCEELLLMVVAHESGLGKYRKQINGPALSLFQIEPYTHDSIWDNCDSINRRAKAMGITRDLSQLENNDEYAIFVARCYLLMDVKPLPTTIEDMAKYCKSYWNRTGKATADKYLEDYLEWKSRG